MFNSLKNIGIDGILMMRNSRFEAFPETHVWLKWLIPPVEGAVCLSGSSKK